jgi:D-methionine transport system permease protein
VSGFTVTLVTLVGASAMAGAIGAGGLGDVAIRYGYQRFDTAVMGGVIVILIVVVSALQFIGDRLARRLNKRVRERA